MVTCEDVPTMNGWLGFSWMLLSWPPVGGFFWRGDEETRERSKRVSLADFDEDGHAATGLEDRAL